MSSSTITMKLLIDKKENRVLFAEAGKECVDFLFHILALPVGSVVKCLTKEAMAGSLGKLYESLENLNDDCLQPNVSKDCLLNPQAAAGAARQVPLLTINQSSGSEAKIFYKCSGAGCYNSIIIGSETFSCSDFVSDGAGACCPACNCKMERVMKFVVPPANEAKPSSEAGYVKGVVTYMIMDDLVVKPMSTISSITLLNKFNVTDVVCLEERDVNLDMDQGLALLNASFMSKTVLTDLFLCKKGI